MADGEGFEPPEALPPQRFSRPSHSTALPTILNFLLSPPVFSNLRFCSLVAAIAAAHHSLALGFTRYVRLAYSYARPRYCPALPTILNFLLSPPVSSNLRFCSLVATGVAAHHSLTLGFTRCVRLAYSYARPRYCPALPHL